MLLNLNEGTMCKRVESFQSSLKEIVHLLPCFFIKFQIKPLYSIMIVTSKKNGIKRLNSQTSKKLIKPEYNMGFLF